MLTVTMWCVFLCFPFHTTIKYIVTLGWSVLLASALSVLLSIFRNVCAKLNDKTTQVIGAMLLICLQYLFNIWAIWFDNFHGRQRLKQTSQTGWPKNHIYGFKSNDL